MDNDTPADGLARALEAAEPSDRLQAALTAGSYPQEAFVVPLLERCAIEPDFFVRDMLTWALARLPHEVVLPRLLLELESPVPQARSQALHTLSKLGEASAEAAITSAHLHDSDTEVARAAWRAAAGLAPESRYPQLARELAQELGRGDLEVMRSLSRAFAELGEAAVPALEAAMLDSLDSPDTGGASARNALAATHARATLRLLEDPEASFVLE